MGWMAKARGWLQGKKTMLGGVVLIAAGIAGAALGQMTVDQGVMVVGLGISVAGWAAKADRHQQQILAALTAAAEAGIQLRAGDKHAAAETLKQGATEMIADVARQGGLNVVEGAGS